MIKDRLFNWANWARVAKFSPSSCKSLESRYKSPQAWNPPEPRTIIDILDAIKVEKAIVSLPRRDINIIVYAYLKSGYNFDAFCSKHKIAGNKYASKTEQFEIEQLKVESNIRLILENRNIY
jgi:hypothetical protein